ncbi:MAG: SDR family NAD(P)-dependent oxidoreductase [Halobacteriota archaeon]|jgi:FlaA1/EpsC-like NDP-sugar epimerase
MSTNAFYHHKTVLMTGAAGSIGSQLVRTLLDANPRAVILTDNNEGALYDLEQDLKSSKVSTFVTDVKDKDSMEPLFDGVDFVFHLAGLKNVPVCEYNPYEAVKTNIAGTHNLVDLCLRENVEKVIFTSTGKAVKPTTAYGATKLLAERLLTLANSKRGSAGTIFASVRFGNVLGSRGSAFPLFRGQIAKGGPVTLTHEEMVRLNIIMPNALRLIMNAGELARGGETFILKMKVMRIAEVAEVMVRELAPEYGYKPEEIEIQLIGVRLGEKIREKLMTESEQRRAYETEDILIVAPEMKELLHRPRILQRLVTPKRDENVQASRSGFCHKRRDKGNIRLLGLSVTTPVAIKTPDTICRQLQQGERYDARRLKDVQNKTHLGPPVPRLTRPLLFCSLFLAG